MDTFNNYRRTDLIQLLRSNKQYLPADVLKHTKEDLINILSNAKELDLSLLESFSEVKTKTKNVKPTPLKTVKAVIVPPVVLGELSDEEEEELEEVIKKPRLVRKKAAVPLPVVKVEIKPPVVVKKEVVKKEVVKVAPVIVQSNKEDELKVKELLKDYAQECRELLDNYDGELDDYDVQSITETYNETREAYENAIDDIIEGLSVPFSEKFYALISKMLDLSLLKIENFIK
jgi:hypothetical protein